MAQILYPIVQQPTATALPVVSQVAGFQPPSQPYLTTARASAIAQMASGQTFDPYPQGTPEFVGPDKWWQPFSERLFGPKGLQASLQRDLFYSESAQFPEVVFIDKYLYPFSEPLRFKPGLNHSNQAAFTTGAHALGTPYSRGYVIC